LGNRNFSLGLSLSPYAPHRKYFQWELYLSTFNESETFLGREDGGVIEANGTKYEVRYRDFYRKTSVVSIDAVPLQLRYNLNSFVGFGAGTWVSVNMLTKSEEIREAYLYRNPQ